MSSINFHCLFRVEAGPKVGLGHLSRCLALAVQLKKKGLESAFVMTEPGPDIRARVAAKGMELIARGSETPVGSSEEAMGLARLAKENNSGWLVIDGYGFDSGYFKLLRQHSLASILSIDDFQGTMEADLILNQNLAVDPNLYVQAKAELLRGPEFCLLDPDIIAGEKIKNPNDLKNILVTTGGGDPIQLTADVVAALSELWDLEVDVVKGPFNNNDYVTTEYKGTHFHYHKAPSSLTHLIQKADLAVMSLGVTTWEMAVLGLPFVMLPIHPAQMPTAEWLAENGYATLGMDLGHFREDRFSAAVKSLLNDRDKLERQSRSLIKLVDGKGAARVAAKMEKIRRMA